MANDNKSWDVDDIDFSEIEFEDLDLDDLDFSVDGELNSISDERPAPARDELSYVAGERPRISGRQNRPVRKVDSKKQADGDDEDRPVRRTPRQGNNKKGGSKAPFIIILCLIVALAVGAILWWLLRDKGEGGKTPSTSTSGEQTKSGEETGTTAAWSKDTEEAVVDLVNSYYAARTLGDVEQLRAILDERVSVSEDKAKAEAKVVDSYQNINVYTTPGRKDGEFVSYVSFEMKFKNINTPAPGLSPCYILKDENGNLRLLTWEYIVANDESLKEYMSEKGSCDAIRELGASVETNFQNAKAQDPTLAEFLESMKKSQSSEEGSGSATKSSEGSSDPAQSGEDTSSEAQSSAQGGDDEEEHFKDADTMMYAQANVRARVKPNTSDDTEFKLVTKGTRVQVTGIGNKWYRVCLKDGSTAYIFKQYLGEEKPADD
ncbi:MAG: SH3 domain-containing protein [Lachnospiraceae bacterium]|nr:SH3 domain-containing protein [Lachnospiraceae bacterium]